MYILHGFMNFIQIGKYKANADTRSQLCHFVCNISKYKTWLNYFQLTKLENSNKKSSTISGFFSDQMKIIKQVNLISIFVRIYYLVSVYLENTDISCVRPTRNSNLLVVSYPNISNGKANIKYDSC